MFRSNLRILALAAFLLLIQALPVSASQLDWTGTGKGAWATFSLIGNPLGTPFSDFVGELTWNWIGSPAAGFSSDSIYTYCVDATSYLQDPQTVTARSTNLLATGSGGAAAGGRVGWLIDTYAASVHATGSNDDAAALQIAIWEALYDSTEGLSSGAFQLLTTGAIHDKAQAYLDALYSVGGGGYHTATATWLDTNAGQDQVVLTPTPEPGSIMLFGSALAYMASRRRKRTLSSLTV
jgi:PEP-CTERM motif